MNQAAQILAAHQGEVGYASLKSRQGAAAAELDSAHHPMRDEAQKARGEADRMKPQMDSLIHQIGSLKAANTLNKGAAGLSAYNAMNDKSAGGALVDGLLAGANAAAASSNTRKIEKLTGDLAQLQAEYAAQIQVAAQFEHTPGDPARVAQAQQELASADAAVHEADAALAPDAGRAQRAQATLAQAKGNVDHLQQAKSYLTNYDQCFTVIARMRFPRGWKQDLDHYWQGLN